MNCAGISGTMGRIDEIGFEDYRRCLEVNLDALWLCEREELKGMMAQDPIHGYDKSLLLFCLRGVYMSELVFAVQL